MNFVGQPFMLKRTKINGKSGDVSFGDDGTARIIGKGTVSLKGRAKAQNVLYVQGLKHDLLSVEQICDSDYNIVFYAHGCEIRRNGSKRIVGRGTRTPGNVYILEEIQGENCYVGRTDENRLWHKILGHLNFDNLVKINKTEVVRGLSKLSNPTPRLCVSCQHGKKIRASFKRKEQPSTSKPLELIHVDLCEHARTQSLQGERYFMLLIDDFTRMVWVTFLREKSEAFDKFKVFKA